MLQVKQIDTICLALVDYLFQFLTLALMGENIVSTYNEDITTGNLCLFGGKWEFCCTSLEYAENELRHYNLCQTIMHNNILNK